MSTIYYCPSYVLAVRVLDRLCPIVTRRKRLMRTSVQLSSSAQLQMWTAFAGVTFCFLYSTATAQETVVPANVLAAIRSNAERLSPFCVQYAHQYQTNLAHDEAHRRLKLATDAKSFFAESVHRLCWQEGEFYGYHKRSVLSDGAPSTSIIEESFDGRTFYNGMPSASPLVIRRFGYRVEKDEPLVNHIPPGYIDAAGFRISLPGNDSELATLTPTISWLLDDGGRTTKVGSVQINGATLVRIEIRGHNPIKRLADTIDFQKLKEELADSKESPERQREILETIQAQRNLPPTRLFVYFLDPKLNYAVRRWEERYDENYPLATCECTAFERIGDRDVWLPQKCQVALNELHTLPGVKLEDGLLSEVFIVTKLDFARVAENQFVLAYSTPGARVRDATLPEASQDPSGYVDYTVPARPEDLERVIEEARNKEHGLASGRSWLNRVLLGLNVLIIAVLFIYFLIRRSARRR